MDLKLSTKSAVITGSSKGIGKAIALALAREGAAVSICARSEGALEATRKELEALGGTVHAQTCDIADIDSLQSYLNNAEQALGGIDILVNNPSGFGSTDDEDGWKKGWDVDLMALVRASWQVVPMMEKSGGGNIIHVSSISGLEPSPGTAPYGAVKAAVIHYTKTQAFELAKKNIRVNSIAPGSIFFEGGVWDEVKATDPAAFQGTLDGIPFGRMGSPEEIANLAAFLASDMASWITGQCIAADGGQMLS